MIELCCEYLSVWCIWLYVIIISCTSVRMNPHSIVCLNVKALLDWSRCHIWSLNDRNVIRTHNQLVGKLTTQLNHLAILVKWLSVRLQTKWLWVRIKLLSLKFQIWRLLLAMRFSTFRQTIECRFTETRTWHDNNVQSMNY